MAQRKTYLVTPDETGEWQVKPEHTSHVTSTHKTEAEAVARAKELANAQGLDRVIIHKEDGSTQVEHTHGEPVSLPRLSAPDVGSPRPSAADAVSVPATHANVPSAETTTDASTTAPVADALFLRLEEVARAGDQRVFVSYINEIDWASHHPDQLIRTIDLALRLEMLSLASELAQLGCRLFPQHDRVRRSAWVLSPPTTHRKHAPHRHTLDASRSWLRDNAKEYRGQWVAVHNGALLGAAESLEELEAVLGQHEDPRSTIITKVL